MIEHNFAESLAASHAAEELPIWERIYREAFPTFMGMHSHRQDGQHQRNGIDRTIVLQHGKTVMIDEKVRGRNKKTGMVYEDIALEYLSDEARGVPGWVCKPLLADYIAYAIAPLGKGYILPVIQLQSAWSQYGRQWQKDYPFVIRAKNRSGGRTWDTLSTGVPVKQLFGAIGGCLRVEFNPIELDE